MLKAGQVVETSSGWLLDIEMVRLWGDDDGEVFGRAMAMSGTSKEWTQTKYLGTVKGIEMMTIRS